MLCDLGPGAMQFLPQAGLGVCLHSGPAAAPPAARLMQSPRPRGQEGSFPGQGPVFPAGLTGLRAALQLDCSCWCPLVAHAGGTSEQTSWSLPIAPQAPGGAMSPLMPRLWVLPHFSPGGFLICAVSQRPRPSGLSRAQSPMNLRRGAPPEGPRWATWQNHHSIRELSPPVDRGAEE